MKDTKEMMRILSENKKKVQNEKRKLEETKEHAIDIAKAIWMCVGLVVFTQLICLI